MTRGYRNNNPLNIRYSQWNAWKGKVTPNTDGAFEQFTSMAYGYRAAMVLLRNYIKQGYKTVEDIIHRWAPENENNTTGYINTVCKETGFDPSTIIQRDNGEAIKKLVYAMSIVENGRETMPDQEAIEDGWKMLGIIEYGKKLLIVPAIIIGGLLAYFFTN